MTPVILYGGGPPIARDPARELARRELQKPVYHQDEPSFVERILNKIGDWLNTLYHSLTGTGGGTGGGWLGLVLLLALLVVVIAAVWWRIGSVRRNATGPKALLDHATTTAEDHRATAERHAAAGEWPEAIRERLRAIARDLEERAIVPPRPGRTADELATEAGTALPDHADALAAGIRLFDDVWYGGRQGDADGYRRLVELDGRLRDARPVPLGGRS
ncbi:DUF4129 domain-containing protein [Actinoallomurus purpureus]|uniref:DUF4129 domain-containing protein n=1 Tax=Actinoallomurus purpureus TaxID=478114 RepID=UPI002092BFCC|nr:DUF4129 domain-containing protein [Actinoallomurus purpureus]MCO6004870.1 DUF4129 domain-containing protein [Actinoallomurus purpureus]